MVRSDLRKKYWILASLLNAALLVAPDAAAPTDYHSLVANPERSDADREVDKRRKPEQLLAFTGVGAGMKVLDLGAGGGYTTELLARAVGPQGVVYAQNTRAREPFDERMKKPVMKNVVSVIRPYDDPAPPEATNLDLITAVLIYHDITFMPVDRAQMNQRLFQALKPGGRLIVVDHAAKAGAGTTVGKSLHRIEEAALRKELEAAGFKLQAEGSFLRDSSDTRDAPFREMSNMASDRFVLKYVKP